MIRFVFISWLCLTRLRLADLGHSVVGVEISEMAIRQFFQENKMTFSEEDVPAVPGAKVFQVGRPGDPSGRHSV